jgi:branched-chain amino acid transport system permease protein
MGMLPQLLVNGLVAGSAYSLMAVSFGLIYGSTRFFHFAHGAVYTAGAYGTYFAIVVLRLPIVVSAALGIGLAAGVGVLSEISVYRPLRQRGAGPASLLLASLGLFIVLQNLISWLFGDDTKALRTSTSESLAVIGARITPIQIVIVATSLVACFAVWIAVRFTPTGRAARAVADDAELCKVVGIDVDQIVVVAFAAGSALAGLAAVLVSLDTDLRPSMGFNALLMGVVAAIVGGVGSIPGALMGGLLLGMAQHLGVWKLATEWQDAIAFCVLILFLVFRPQGFFGLPLRRTAV